MSTTYENRVNDWLLDGYIKPVLYNHVKVDWSGQAAINIHNDQVAEIAAFTQGAVSTLAAGGRHIGSKWVILPGYDEDTLAETAFDGIQRLAELAQKERDQ